MADPVRRADRRYTYRDYRDWPEGERWELIDGVAWDMSPAPSRRHQAVVVFLASAFHNALGNGPCRTYVAPFDVVLPESPAVETDEASTVVQPDVSVFCDPSVLTDAGATGAPTLVIEVISPSTASKDMRIKRELYERHGVEEYWIVDPGNQFVEVWMLEDERRYREDPVLYEPRREPSLSPSTPALSEAGIMVDLHELFAGR